MMKRRSFLKGAVAVSVSLPIIANSEIDDGVELNSIAHPMCSYIGDIVFDGCLAVGIVAEVTPDGKPSKFITSANTVLNAWE